jgi:hypothetical protein
MFHIDIFQLGIQYNRRNHGFEKQIIEGYLIIF